MQTCSVLTSMTGGIAWLKEFLFVQKFSLWDGIEVIFLDWTCVAYAQQNGVHRFTLKVPDVCQQQVCYINTEERVENVWKLLQVLRKLRPMCFIYSIQHFAWTFFK